MAVTPADHSLRAKLPGDRLEKGNTADRNLPSVRDAKGDTGMPFDAKVWRGGDGIWRMQATRWLPGVLGYTDYGDLELAPGFSLRPLPRFEGSIPQ